MHALTAFAAGNHIRRRRRAVDRALVSTPTLPIVSLSRGVAGYIAVGGVGVAAFTAKDLLRSDLATASLTFTSPDQVLPL